MFNRNNFAIGISIIALLVSAGSLFYSIYTNNKLYIDAENRVKIHKYILDTSFGLANTFCNNKTVFCESSIDGFKEKLDEYKKIVETEKLHLDSVAYKAVITDIVSYESRVKELIAISYSNKIIDSEGEDKY